MTWKTLLAAGAALGAILAAPALAADLVLVGVDAKFADVKGAAGDPRPAPNDSLVLLDAARSPPRVVRTVTGLDHSLMGPPQSVALSPDGKLAVASSPTSWDFATGREKTETYITLADLRQAEPRLAKVELGANPNAVMFTTDGRRLLVTCTDGTLKVLAVENGSARLLQSLKLGRRLTGLAVTRDGRRALAGVGGEGLALLDLTGDEVRVQPDRLPTGPSSYDMEVSDNGRWLAVTSLAGTPGADGKPRSDIGMVSVVDLAASPRKVTHQVQTPATPEGVAISKDGRWVVVLAAAGSNLPATNPAHSPTGRIALYENRAGQLTAVNDLPAGAAGQGVVFAADGRTVLAEFNLDNAVAVFRVEGGRLVDTGQRVALSASPVAIARQPSR
ncbi:WD40 repeat domain-containing protein [Phenylobacterium deserti]|uniref:YncE family protein n=1 Tax=Phenylobacterium deserti TaxID=1914756 RepID=A0A328ADG5_9CAUL|nr:YncE family protein [Phenylobacterium deserti]RAK50768.1 YncE family protein [Phenylobacterium deserti]